MRHVGDMFCSLSQFHSTNISGVSVCRAENFVGQGLISAVQPGSQNLLASIIFEE